MTGARAEAGAREARGLMEDGDTARQSGPAAATQPYRHALQPEPHDARAAFQLGCALLAEAGPAEALPQLRRAALLRPDWVEARSTLGFALARSGRMAEAADEFQAAARSAPENAGIRNDLGLALSALGRGEEAHAAFQEALRLDSGYPEVHNNLAILFEQYGRTSEAIASCRQALALRPDYPEAHSNLANALKSQGRHAEAVAHYREALRLRPGWSDTLSSLLFALCYPAGVHPVQLYAEHLAYGAAHRFPPARHDNEPAPDRILRIGYVSADFRGHAVARFIEPVLRHHDRNRFQVYCYSNVTVPDATSRRLGALADCFRSITGMPDQAAAALIRADRIDILVDLSGHSAGNRLPLFAMKPAPLQVTWLGYPQTTGLTAIDYRITDALSDPPGASERFHSERLLRLPGAFTCFQPPEEAPPVGALPVLTTGAVTFGSFNNPAKITPETVALWAAVLRRVPGSRMLVKGYALADSGSRERLSSLFLAQGIGPERLELAGNTPSYRDHLLLYARVDIALDTFPYHGTTTTCEALWMGVPVVTLAGDSHRSRVGCSLLSALGLSGLVASDERGYCRIAVELAQDTGRLARLRGTLRASMQGSPLTDAVTFTGHLEAAFRAIWHAWCSGAGPRQEKASAADQAQLRYAELLLQKGMRQEATAQLKEILDRDPASFAAHYALAVLGAEGNPAAAARHFAEALATRPDDTAASNGLGVVLQQSGRAEEAALSYLEALRRDPYHEDARINLALLLKEHARLGAAQRHLEEALLLRPDSLRLRYNLANILQFQGRSVAAVAAYREVLRRDPGHLDALQNLLFALHYSPRFSDRQIFEEHLDAARSSAFLAAPPRPRVPLDRAPRRIRVGYLSPDFRCHAVASFIEPILRQHDPALVEVTCYANVARPDRTTERLAGLAERWRDISRLDDQEAAALIARDGIDIMVDLAGHTSGNRLPLLAGRVAPVQLTWIGYPDTTGLAALDYRLTDRLADPPETADTLHSERLVRLPRSFCCYLPPDFAPAVAAAPCLKNGRITFGSFNNLAKVTPEVLALWARVLLAVPGSHLLLKANPLADPEVCERIRETLVEQGVAAGRIELHPGKASAEEHLAHYARVDIALDTFPYNGTTTTCEALWMGVPVITLAGTRHAGRTGVSLLTNCGLAELVAQSPEEYLALARSLAENAGRLQELRAGMRERLSNSPLTDAAGVTRELEGVYLRMLREDPGLAR